MKADTSNTIPLISVIIPCYNKECFIIETLDSILNQAYKECIKEVIVVDDGSTDNSSEIIKAKAIENPLIRYVYQSNAGVSAARNKAIELVTADYIAFIDGDDIWEPDKLEVFCEYIKKYPNVGLFYSNLYDYEAEKNKLTPIKVIAYQHDEKQLLQKFVANGAPVIPSTVVAKTLCFKHVGVFDTGFLHGGEDIDMWLRIAQHFSFQHIDKFTLRKRKLANSLGANTVENAKGYKIALDKIEKAVPSIAPFRKKRDALIAYKIALYLFKKGEYNQSVTEIKQSLKKNPSLSKAGVLYLIVKLKQYTGLNLFKLTKK